jgi:hypothetical protein
MEFMVSILENEEIHIIITLWLQYKMWLSFVSLQ